MKTEDGKPPGRRWIKDRRGAIEAKLDNFALHDDEDGLRSWLSDEAELDEGSEAFQAALLAYSERHAQIHARPRRRAR